MEKISCNGNVLNLNERSIRFDYDIQDIKLKDNRILVLLKDDSKNLNKENLFCLSLDGKVLWKIGPEKGKHGFYPFVGISNNYFAVVDFIGRRFFLDTDNGEIIDIDIVK